MQSDLREALRPTIADIPTGSRRAATRALGRKAAATGGTAGLRKSYSPSQVLWIISGAPWIWGGTRGNDSAAMELHRYFQRYCWRGYGVVGRILAGAGFIAGMPIVLALMIRCTRIRGAAVTRETGKSRIRQLREQLSLWLGQGVLPLSYYIFELYDEDIRATALSYLYRYETKRGIYAILRDRFSSAETTDALRNKAAFALRCQRYGVAAIPALFSIHRGILRRLDRGGSGLPRRDLFLKPLSGSGGRGAAVWLHTGNGSYRNPQADALTESELIDHLAQLSEHEPYIGRPYVRNHSGVADLSPGALSSVRIVTCLDENYRPEATHAVLRMARNSESLVDNFHAGGIAARVDLETGMIGAATDIGLNANTQWWSIHPATGAQILGRHIPMWPEVLDLVLRAHAIFPDHIVVGWDVAILEDGPQLIEGNKSPDLDIVQRTGRAPAGNSRLGVLLAHHLRCTDPELARSHLEPQAPSQQERPIASEGTR